jgi:hypothetical protein
MAGISTSISRKDLEFMAGDIGPELVPFLQPEDLLKGMDAEKQRRLLALLSVEERLSGISTEELIKGIRPEQRKALFEFLLKMLAAGLEEKPEVNGKSNGH